AAVEVEERPLPLAHDAGGRDRSRHLRVDPTGEVRADAGVEAPALVGDTLEPDHLLPAASGVAQKERGGERRALLGAEELAAQAPARLHIDAAGAQEKARRREVDLEAAV